MLVILLLLCIWLLLIMLSNRLALLPLIIKDVNCKDYLSLLIFEYKTFDLRLLEINCDINSLIVKKY